MKPTIGRKVWFWLNGASIGAPGTKQPEEFRVGQPMDATIVCVWGHTMVNLSVTDHGGTVHSIRSVPLRESSVAALPQGMYCEWKTYQLVPADKPGEAAALTLTVSKETAAALERIIQKIDEKMFEEQ